MSRIGIGLVLAVVLGVLVLLPWGLQRFTGWDENQMSAFGQSYGLASAVFAGVALAVALYTSAEQSEHITRQAEALASQAEALARSAAAQEEAAKILAAQFGIQKKTFEAETAVRIEAANVVPDGKGGLVMFLKNHGPAEITSPTVVGQHPVLGEYRIDPVKHVVAVEDFIRVVWQKPEGSQGEFDQHIFDLKFKDGSGTWKIVTFERNGKAFRERPPSA